MNYLAKTFSQEPLGISHEIVDTSFYNVGDRFLWIEKDYKNLCYEGTWELAEIYFDGGFNSDWQPDIYYLKRVNEPLLQLPYTYVTEESILQETHIMSDRLASKLESGILKKYIIEERSKVKHEETQITLYNKLGEKVIKSVGKSSYKPVGEVIFLPVKYKTIEL